MDCGCVVCVYNQYRFLVNLINWDMFDIMFSICDCLIVWDWASASHNWDWGNFFEEGVYLHMRLS